MKREAQEEALHLEIEDLQKRAKKKALSLARARRDPRYRTAVGVYLRAGLLTTNTKVEAVKGPASLKDILWAGRVEPRLLELLPAVLIKKPSLVDVELLPSDLKVVLERLRRHQIPPDFRGVSGEKLAEWVPRVGQKNKLPSRLKAFRFRKEDLELLSQLAASHGVSETEVLRKGLVALSKSESRASSRGTKRLEAKF